MVKPRLISWGRLKIGGGQSISAVRLRFGGRPSGHALLRLGQYRYRRAVFEQRKARPFVARPVCLRVLCSKDMTPTPTHGPRDSVWRPEGRSALTGFGPKADAEVSGAKCPLVTNSVEKLDQPTLAETLKSLRAFPGKLRIKRTISANHSCAKAGSKYSHPSFSTQSTHNGHSSCVALRFKGAETSSTQSFPPALGRMSGVEPPAAHGLCSV